LRQHDNKEAQAEQITMDSSAAESDLSSFMAVTSSAAVAEEEDDLPGMSAAEAATKLGIQATNHTLGPMFFCRIKGFLFESDQGEGY
jgi:hypothetical protein